MTAEYVELTENVLSDLQCTQSNYSRGHNLAKHQVKVKVKVKQMVRLQVKVKLKALTKRLQRTDDGNESKNCIAHISTIFKTS